MLEKTMRVNALYDFYQSLLTPKQQRYMNLYYIDDYSLGEIAETFDVSRQAVYDNLRRTEAMLEDFEVKLALYNKYMERTKIIGELRTILSQEDHVRSTAIQHKIAELENLD
ncbi:putative DNA-binding protein [Tuberibacillus sp. Marseille-P3662]|uniref:putative DNA-binding protein n=1 Tax=Tuberibacillus sp. Marseille-P3662 TaxID=1965358 RepID=UPI000A1CDBE1|nr:putative DNA-binding protein [Tuberibacillus sp. Marseille-P3662]